MGYVTYVGLLVAVFSTGAVKCTAAIAFAFSAVGLIGLGLFAASFCVPDISVLHTWANAIYFNVLAA